MKNTILPVLLAATPSCLAQTATAPAGGTTDLNQELKLNSEELMQVLGQELYQYAQTGDFELDDFAKFGKVDSN